MTKDEEYDKVATIAAMLVTMWKGYGNLRLVDLISHSQKELEDKGERLSFDGLIDCMNVYLQEYYPADIHARPRFTCLNGVHFPIENVVTFTADNKYSYLNSEMEYRLLINKTELAKSPCDNLVLKFDSPVDRDKAVEKLKELKAALGGVKFVE